MSWVHGITWSLDGTLCDLEFDAEGRLLSRVPSTAERSGKYALPGFVDTHCHVVPAGLELTRPSLRGCSSREEALERLLAVEKGLPPDAWLFAVQYDQNRFSDAGHLTRKDLDSISPTRPIVIKHTSNHASVANSAALRAAGFADDVKDPEDGTFGRFADGTINGVLNEKPSFDLLGVVPKPDFEGMVAAIRAGADSMASYGIQGTCDMWTGWTRGEMELDAYVAALDLDLPVRMRLYLDWNLTLGKRRMDEGKRREILAALSGPKIRVAGVKLFADGALGARTAGIYGKYTGPDTTTQVPSTRKEREALGTSGQLIYSPAELTRRVQVAHDAGFSVSIHSIGDYTTDLVLDAFEATGDASRHRIEHCSLLHDDQIERLAKLNLHLAMQPEFLSEFGNSYAKVIPPERLKTMKRFRSVLDAGVRTTFSSDRPICVGDPWAGIAAATNHPFNPAESLTRREALSAYCETPLQALDADLGGRVQILDFDPMAGNPPA